MSIFLIRYATFQSSSYPIVLTSLGGSRSRPNSKFKICGSAGNRTRDLMVNSQTCKLLDQRGGRYVTTFYPNLKWTWNNSSLIGSPLPSGSTSAIYPWWRRTPMLGLRQRVELEIRVRFLVQARIFSLILLIYDLPTWKLNFHQNVKQVSKLDRFTSWLTTEIH